MPRRSSTGATGTPAADRRPTSSSRVPAAMAPATACWSSAPRRHRSSKPRAENCPSPSACAQARPEVLLVHDAQRNLPAVRRGEEAVPRDDHGGAVASGPVGRSGSGGSGPGGEHVGHGNVQVGPLAAAHAAQDGGADPEGGGHPCGQVGGGEGRVARGRPALGRQRPCPRVVVHVVAGEKGPRVVLAVAGNGAVDDARVPGPHGRLVHAEPGQDPGAESLHDHIGLCRQSQRGGRGRPRP